MRRSAAPLEKGPPWKAVGSVEKPRTQNAAGISEVTLLKTLRAVNAESQVVAAVGAAGTIRPGRRRKEDRADHRRRVRHRHRRRGPPRLDCRAANLGTEAESLGEPQIHRRMRWAGGVVDGSDFFAGSGGGVESSERRAVGSRRWRRLYNVGHVAVETSPGRSLKMESLLRSLVVVMLKGDPELAIMNGLRRKL